MSIKSNAERGIEIYKKTGIVPMAWQGGVQAFIVGKLK